MKRSGFKRPQLVRERAVSRPIPEHLRRASASPSVGQNFRPLPKTEPQRCRALLDMAQGRPCLLLAPVHGADATDTTVACHGNGARFGKGERRKADDHYSVWGCFACHTWLDQGSAPQALKDEVFTAAMARQIEHWRAVASNPWEPERLRRAARWALDLHDEPQ